MRLDKYLKNTRLIKRREVAKVLIDEGSILVNKKVVKPSYVVKLNDVVSLRLGERFIVIKIIEISENVNKEHSAKLYEIIEEKLK